MLYVLKARTKPQEAQVLMERNVSLDILKLSMAFMVVAAHARFLSEISPLGEYLTVNGLFRIILPVFLIINGFFFPSFS